MCKVTVIICTYNQENSIARAIESVLSQNFNGDFEILIGDDSSTDSTRKICEDYQRNYPSLIRIMPPAPNKRLTDNYLDCVLAARGSYICDVAGDDSWCDTLKLEQQSAILDKHPEVSMVHSAWRAVPAGTIIKCNYPFISDGNDLLISLLRHTKPQPLHLSTAMYRREEFLKIYNENPSLFRGKCAEDITLSAVLLHNRKVAYMDNPTLNYTVGEGSASSPASFHKMARFTIDSLTLTCEIADWLGINSILFKSWLKPLAAHAVGSALKSRDNTVVTEVLKIIDGYNIPLTLKSRLKIAIWKFRHKRS